MGTLGFVFATASISARALTAEIPSLIENQNAEVLASEKDVQAASQSIWTARSRYYPAINVMSTYLHVGNDLSGSTSKVSVTDLGGVLSGSVTLPPITLQMQTLCFLI